MVVAVLQSFGHGEPDPIDFSDTPARFSDDLGSACSTPFVSAPSSPCRGSSSPPGYFFSAPASPMHFVLYSAPSSSTTRSTESEFPKHDSSSLSEFEFDFSSQLSSSSGPLDGGSMISADELFSNGQIKPLKLSSHLQKPQILAPLLDLETEEEEDDGDFHGEIVNRRGRDLKLRSRSVNRKARSLSPLRNQCEEENDTSAKLEDENVPCAETTPSCSASSTGRNSMKWIFLNNLLHRSKSEGGRANGKEKFWSNISFSPCKEKKTKSQPLTQPSDDSTNQTQKQKQPTPKGGGKPTNGIAKRRGLKPSAHELHYTTNRAQAEEMKKRTYLPYRHGLFGCLGFTSKGYTALNGLARSLNTVSSR